MNRWLLLCVLLVLVLVGCGSDEMPIDPDELRLRANQIEDAQARGTALAQADAVERRNSTRGAATVAVFELTQDAARLALAVERDSVTETARAVQRRDDTTMAAAVAEATGTAVARTTEDAQVEALFRQEMAYEQQQMQRQLVHDYVMDVLVWLCWLAFIVLLLGIVFRLMRGGRSQVGDGPQMVQVHGATLLRDSSRASLPERLLAPGSSGPWTVVSRPRVGAVDVPLLPASAPQEIELPALEVGHVLIAGETGSGKSTAMRSVLVARRGVTVLDPHAAPDEWPGAHVIGGGRNFEAINAYMDYMRSLLSERYAEREGGRRAFDCVTVATDEMPAIVAALGGQIGDAWREWLREGRKVGLFFVVSTQSTRVATLGIKGEGDLLANFGAVIELGKVARGNHPDLVGGQRRPAVLTTVAGTRPVVIPHRPQMMVPQEQVLNVTPPALFDDPLVTGLQTERGNITAGQFREAKRLLAVRASNGYPSGNEIQRKIWGHSGGNAYYYLKQIEEAIRVGAEVV